MKRWIVILVALAMAALGGAALARIYLHRVVKSEVSEVFMRYKDRDDLQVGFVKAYRIDDSTFVDVTTITAHDSASWESLLKEMNVNNIILAKQRKAAREGRVTVIEYFCVKNHPEEKVKVKEYSDFDLVMCYYGEKTIYIFDVKSIEQSIIIKAHKNDELLN